MPFFAAICARMLATLLAVMCSVKEDILYQSDKRCICIARMRTWHTKHMAICHQLQHLFLTVLIRIVGCATFLRKLMMTMTGYSSMMYE